MLARTSAPLLLTVAGSIRWSSAVGRIVVAMCVFAGTVGIGLNRCVLSAACALCSTTGAERSACMSDLCDVVIGGEIGVFVCVVFVGLRTGSSTAVSVSMRDGARV